MILKGLQIGCILNEYCVHDWRKEVFRALRSSYPHQQSY